MTDRMKSSEFLDLMKRYYEETSPFNRLLGIKMESLGFEKPSALVRMKEDLVGNTHMQILHGGVIATMLDFIGGVAVHVKIVEKMQDNPPEEIGKELFQVGTIDLRVDFIRPGRGELFLATGEMMRFGNKVAVTRSELQNEKGILIAAATGTYLVG